MTTAVCPGSTHRSTPLQSGASAPSKRTAAPRRARPVTRTGAAGSGSADIGADVGSGVAEARPGSAASGTAVPGSSSPIRSAAARAWDARVPSSWADWARAP